MNRNVKELLNEVRDQISNIDACYLLGNALRKEKEFLFAHPEYYPSYRQLKRWEQYKLRRIKGEPCAYITGEKEFYNLLFKVNRKTLIPRPDTEILTGEIMYLNPGSLLDLGTGAGNIAISVKYYLRNCSIVAVDRSREILRVAERNAKRILGKHDIRFIKSIFFQNLKGERFDIIASNPPYIKSADIGLLQKEVKDFEPIYALNGGIDGLAAYKVILREGKNFLNNGGKIILEMDPELKGDILNLVEKYHYRIEKIERDLAGLNRTIVLMTSPPQDLLDTQNRGA